MTPTQRYRAANTEACRQRVRDDYARKMADPERSEAYREKRRADRHAAPIRYMVNQAKTRAKAAGLPFDITRDDVTIPAACPALGIPLRVSRGRLTDSSPTIDRITPALGYVRGNIAVISFRANRIKNDSTIDELVKLAVWLKTVTLRNT